MSVMEVLSLHRGKGLFVEDVRRVVANCPKQRFTLRDDPSSGQLQICANQGHSMEVYTESWFYSGSCYLNLHQVKDLELVPILSAEEVPLVVHGTYRKAWLMIKDQVLLCSCGAPLLRFGYTGTQ